MQIKVDHVVSAKILGNISDETYFSSDYSNYISNSKLSLINPDEGGSPEKYAAGLANNKIYSNPMEFGSAVHELMLQPELFFLDTNIEKPSGKLSFVADMVLKSGLSNENIIKACEEVKYFEGKLSDEKILEFKSKLEPFYNYALEYESDYDGEKHKKPIWLSGYDQWRCGQCVTSLTQHSEVQKLLYPSDRKSINEGTILVEIVVSVEENGIVRMVPLTFKGKLDNYSINDDETELTLNDLKTTGKSIDLFLSESYNKYHYSRQIGLYLYFLKMIHPTVKSGSANIIAVETSKPFTSKVFPIPLESIQLGLKEAANLVHRVAFHEVFGYDKIMEDYE